MFNEGKRNPPAGLVRRMREKWKGGWTVLVDDGLPREENRWIHFQACVHTEILGFVPKYGSRLPVARVSFRFSRYFNETAAFENKVPGNFL